MTPEDFADLASMEDTINEELAAGRMTQAAATLVLGWIQQIRNRRQQGSSGGG